jgi:hypothetical protein
MNAWESIFLQSPVNDGCYDEDNLPQTIWPWPKDTWFRNRLDFLREHEPVLSLKAYRKLVHQADRLAA